jgi:hypothetical protein
MSKAESENTQPGHVPIDLHNLSERDRDFLVLNTRDVMNMYGVEKQVVYDRRHLLSRKIKEANTTVDAILRKAKAARTARREEAKATPQPAPHEKPERKVEDRRNEEKHESRKEIVASEKATPVLMKPIEINFENFSIKLNGVPKKISVNPETHAIEIDL